MLKNVPPHPTGLKSTGKISYYLIWSFEDLWCPQIKRKPQASLRLLISPARKYCCPKEGSLRSVQL